MDLKIMTFNVLNGWNTTKIGIRDDLAAEAIGKQSPDLLCLQEFDPCYRGAEQPLQQLIAPLYAEAGEGSTWNPVFYRKDRLTLLSCGEVPFERGTTYPYPRGGISGFRTVFHVLLEDKTDGKRILVMNLHYDMCKDKEALLENQAHECRQAVALATALEEAATPDVTLVTGDYNARITGVPCVYMLENGFTDTHESALEKDDRGSCSPLGEPLWGNYSHAIDHVLYRARGPVTVLRYLTVDDIRAASDHSPVCVTLRLG